MTPDDTIHNSTTAFTTEGASSNAKVDSASASEDMTRFSPLEWSEFFETKRRVAIPSELDSTGLEFTVYEINADKKDLPVIVLHHGAGHCALSFAATAKELKKRLGNEVRILSLDVRGHGETTSRDQLNIHLDQLAKDLQNLLITLYGPSQPELLLVGHSMGGSVVTEVATREMVPNIKGIAVLDILQVYKEMALGNVRLWCENRPPTLETVEQAIQWGVLSGTVRNVDSARASFPGMVTRTSSSSAYTWHTDLIATEHLWPTWFDGQNQKFLSVKSAKFLVLGGHGFLDEEMNAAHEKGQFRMLIFAGSGHAVQEDEPARMGEELAAFWRKK